MLFGRAFDRIGLIFGLCTLVVVSSLILGGGTRGGFLSDAALQLIALPLLLLVLWRLLDTPLSKQAQLATGFCLALVAVPLLQLVPLPPQIWASLPNREISVQAFALIGQALPWMPLSVSPHLTWLSALSLIAPLAIFLAVLLLSYRERRWLSVVILAVGTISVFVGLAQVAQGPESSLRFFEYTNPTEAVGFFANRNHFAALGYALVLLTVAWVASATFSASIPGEERDIRATVTAVIWFTLLVVLLAGEAMARSRAGLGLTILALFGAFALGASDRRARQGVTSPRLLIGAILLAVLLAAQYALYRILERFEADPLTDARLSFIPTTIEAAKAFMPLGSGLGTFVPVYALFEKPEDTMLNTYANHAHNDIAEIWLETGVLGLVLMGAFALWFTLRSIRIWRGVATGATETDASLARAATLIILLFVLHSFVDYPLRTSAIMAVVAFCCALMIKPLSSPEPATEPQTLRAAKPHVAVKPQTPPASPPKEPATPAPTPASPQPPKEPASPPHHATTPTPQTNPADERWGTDIEWPDEWGSSEDSKS